MSTWVLIANSGHAQIYATQRAKLFQADKYDDSCIELIDKFKHKESTLKTGELVSDKVGNFNYYIADAHGGKDNMIAGSFTEPKDPKEHEAEIFAKFIADKLDEARKQNKFKDLVIVAAPRFSGMVKQKLSHPLSKLVSNTIEKDYVSLSKRELVNALQEQL